MQGFDICHVQADVEIQRWGSEQQLNRIVYNGYQSLTDAEGKAVKAGEQTEIGGNDRYVALCRRHFVEALAG